MPHGRPRMNGTGATVPCSAAAQTTGQQVPFAYKLVLNQWLLSLFNVKRFEELAEHLRNEIA